VWQGGSEVVQVGDRDHALRVLKAQGARVDVHVASGADYILMGHAVAFP
jgi:hypothetical protein